MREIDFTLSEVSKNRPNPITRQIAELIMKNIETGILMPGDRLPTERSLAQELMVSRGTVKSAYRYLEQHNVIRTRQGSGSFVIRDEELSQKLRRERAVALLTNTIAALGELGFSITEMSHLFDACIDQISDAVVNVAIICNSAELLLDISRQLSFKPGVAASIFILESITESKKPEELLRGFDIIVTPSLCYRLVSGLLPALRSKLIEAAVSPAAETLIQLTALSRDSRIGIICRTNAFLSTVKSLLLSFGYLEDNILSFFEMDYTTRTYFPGGINALISFSDAHIFTNPDFAFRNDEFLAKGGRIIAFKHQLEQGTLLMLEDRTRCINVEKAGNSLV